MQLNSLLTSAFFRR